MAEELIQQLKEASAHCEGGDSYNSRLMRKAAREIETLRAQLPSQGGEAVAWLNVATGCVTTLPVVVMDWDDEGEEVQSLYTHPADKVPSLTPSWWSCCVRLAS